MSLSVRLLGTGGAANAERHQACLLLTWGDEPQVGRVLLDTGNGLDVVRRTLASGFAPNHVRDIFVSHQHVDHVGGLEPLLLWSAIQSLRHRGRPPTEPIRVYAEPRVIESIRSLFDAIASAAPRLLGDSLQFVPMPDGTVASLRGAHASPVSWSIISRSMGARWDVWSSWTGFASRTAATRDRFRASSRLPMAWTY